jgi:mRNA interferase MazF
MKGEVAIVPFPFSDLLGTKRRPALIIADWGGDDVILCQITSKLKYDGYEIELKESDFESGKLPLASNIRPNKIFTANRNNIISVAGKISINKYQKVIEQIFELIKVK